MRGGEFLTSDLLERLWQEYDFPGVSGAKPGAKIWNPRRSWRSSPAARQAFSQDRPKSGWIAHAPIGPGCASTSRRRSHVRVVDSAVCGLISARRKPSSANWMLILHVSKRLSDST
jgi:hypothetical protein